MLPKLSRLLPRRGFAHGIHPPESKADTAAQPIRQFPFAPLMIVPLLQHAGKAALPVVRAGQEVLRGELLAEPDGPLSVAMHAPASGRIEGIELAPSISGRMQPAIYLKPHPGSTQEAIEGPPCDVDTASPEQILRAIQWAGIVGLGGAAFPTWRKLEFARQSKVDTVVMNGAECEPYLTSDYRMMLAHPAEIIEGSVALARIVGASRVLVGVESDKPDAVRVLEREIARRPAEGPAVKVVPCLARYPQGAERQLVYATTGRSVPLRQLPTAVGVLVQNVATAHAVHDALRYRRPLLDRVLTVTGPGIRAPRNVRAPLGASLADVVAFCGGLNDDTTRMVAGGPMMGRSLPRLDVPLIKGMNGLVLLTGKGPLEDGFAACIRCGRCLDACPLGLEPDQVSIRVEAGRPLDTEPHGPLDCYECGCCSYVCPSGRPLVQFMQVAKGALRRAAETRAS